MMSKYFVTVILVMLVFPANAAWEKLGKNLEKGETHFYDPQTVRLDGQYRKVWVLSSYDEERTGGYRSVKTFYEFNCEQARSRSQTMLLYPDTLAQGKVVGAFYEESKEWSDYSLDSIFAQISDTVCSK